MNILPHKSWHVRTKKNIERVRRDEEKAAEEEKEKQRRIALAEQESRTELLRQRAKKQIGDGDGSDGKGSKFKVVTYEDITSEVVEAEPLQHINFFSDLEEGKKLSGAKNTEHEKDKKAEQEQLEMKIGLLTYLGQGSAEAQTEKPWYLKRGKHDQEKQDLSKTWKMKRKLDADDPMKQMEEYVSKKNKSSHTDRHKHKKHKHKGGSESKQVVSPSTGKSISQLRAVRLKREAMEKQKTEKLLRKLRGEEVPDDKPAEELSSSGQRYNSQYNPALLRQPRSRGHSHYTNTNRESQEFGSTESNPRNRLIRKSSHSEDNTTWSDNRRSHAKNRMSSSEWTNSGCDRSRSESSKTHSRHSR